MPRLLFTRVAALLLLTGALTTQAQGQKVSPVATVVTAAATVRLAPPVHAISALPTTAMPSAPSPLAAPAASIAVAPQTRPLRLLFLGPPGVGKSTLGKLMSQDYGMIHISVGELLREKAKNDPELAQAMSQGDLVDSEIVRRVVIERLAAPDVREHGFILDGFPRRSEEIGVIESWLKDGGVIDALVHLEATDEELRGRIIARGRADDSEEVFRKRLEIYRQQTRPVLEHFRQTLNVLDVDAGSPDISANYAKVRALLDDLLARP